MDRCISILVPKDDDLFTVDDFENSKKPRDTGTVEPEITDNDDENSEDDSSEDDFVEVAPKKSKEELDEDRYVELRYLGLLNEQNNAMSLESFRSISIDLNLRENEDNKVVIDIMRDLYKELKKSSMVKINNWIKVYINEKPSIVKQ